MDEDATLAALHQLQLEEWLDELARNEAARREFEGWIASTHRMDTHEPQQSH